MRYADKDKTIKVVKKGSVRLNGRNMNVYEFRRYGVFMGRYVGKTMREAIEDFYTVSAEIDI